MANRPAPFRQADISRALKGAKAAGFAVGRVEISTDGRIVILPKDAQDPDASDTVDKWLEGYHARATQGA